MKLIKFLKRRAGSFFIRWMKNRSTEKYVRYFQITEKVNQEFYNGPISEKNLRKWERNYARINSVYFK